MSRDQGYRRQVLVLRRLRGGLVSENEEKRLMLLICVL